jgi:hypothetical protein
MARHSGSSPPADLSHGRPVPLLPTDAAPGSEAKILAMAERFARGEYLHHPDDSLVLARKAAGQAGHNESRRITWNEERRLWRVRVWDGKKLKHIGYYASKREARLALEKVENT